jgi:hypothetical protein
MHQRFYFSERKMGDRVGIGEIEKSGRSKHALTILRVLPIMTEFISFLLNYRVSL